MSDEDKKGEPNSFPNSFIWFLIAAMMMIFMVQNFVETKFAKVSFSYQLEHLVNLQLLQPEDSRKVAVNDNLVTFSGKFRDRLTDEGKNRFKFLDLLNSNHELTAENEKIKNDLISQKEKVVEAAQEFLFLSGTAIPSSGYHVVQTDLDDGSGSLNVIISNLSREKSGVTLPNVEKTVQSLQGNPTPASIEAAGHQMQELLRGFKSQTLGIGNEGIKQSLRTIDQEVNDALGSGISPSEKIAVFQKGIDQLNEIVKELNTQENGVRLGKLRAVRNYQDELDLYKQESQKLEDNQLQLDKARQTVSSVIWFYNNQELSTRSLEKQDSEQFAHWFAGAKEEWEGFTHNRSGFFKAPDQPVNSVLEKTFKSEEPSPNYFSYLFTFLPVLLVMAVLYYLFARQMRGVGSGAMNFGKSPAKLMTKGQNKITFKDVAGVDEALEELEEIVEFLKNPQKFTTLGGRIPKGVLCIGPPGTGKTLIAKAVAGEADRPFFSISGSDFVEMFVGVGASRIRDLFDQAKKNAPCIIFMDEIDAVGRHRGAGIGGGHDEREQTLNQLLVEMDGFDTNEGVILMAATNRPDVLDKALLRPGRFDRRVIIGLPDIKGRFDILKVHARKIKLDTSVDLMSIARSTPGSSGADLANLLNEAALLAARRNRSAVTMQEVVEARDKVLYGKERRSLELDQNEKLTTAYHESGHAIVGLICKHADPIDKVTIIPRGMSLGSTMFLPRKNKVSYWKNELYDQLAVLMGGRCAEEVFVGDVSSGAQQDIERATHIARSMVCEWGMSEKVGTIALDEKSEAGQYLGTQGYHEKKYSEETARMIDAEVKRILDEANKRAHDIIHEYRKELELMTQMLIEFETLDSEDVQKIIKGEFDIQEKQARLKFVEELHKKGTGTTTPPQEPSSESKVASNDEEISPSAV